MSFPSPLPLIGLIAYGSNTGKTTLLRQVIPLLRAQGLRPALVKHVHCDFDIDTPGKDSYELRQAGADQVLVASGHRWALMKEEAQPDNYPDLASLVQRLDLRQADLILAEGFKEASHAKIEVHRHELGQPCLFPHDQTIMAVATNQANTLPPCQLPILDLNNPRQIADFIIKFYDLQK